jgi:hypothetical protein
MSTLVAQTISNGTISTSTANVINGAKAWVNFNGTGTVAIRASYNVSSITDNGTGQYQVNFTNAFANANYAPQGSADFMGGNNPNVTISDYIYGSPPSTTSCKVFVREYLGNYIDPAGCYIAIFA